MRKTLELLADLFLIFGGVFFVYVFIVIEVLHGYGSEPNAWIRHFEIGMGVFMVLLGVNRLIQDFKK